LPLDGFAVLEPEWGGIAEKLIGVMFPAIELWGVRRGGFQHPPLASRFQSAISSSACTSCSAHGNTNSSWRWMRPTAASLDSRVSCCWVFYGLPRQHLPGRVARADSAGGEVLWSRSLLDRDVRDHPLGDQVVGELGEGPGRNGWSRSCGSLSAIRLPSSLVISRNCTLAAIAPWSLGQGFAGRSVAPTSQSHHIAEAGQDHMDGGPLSAGSVRVGTRA
jgi:hypothetical protein